jgi:hypothetical protein
MNYVRRQSSPAKVLFVALFCVATVLTLVKLSKASIGNVTKGDLAGPWQATVVLANSGCGPMTMVVNFTLNGSGSATNASLVEHGACGDSTLTGQTFTISSLSSNGSGTASLSCGVGCGWGFTIQVAPDRSIFNLADVLSSNPNNFVEGTAIHQ